MTPFPGGQTRFSLTSMFEDSNRRNKWQYSGLGSQFCGCEEPNEHGRRPVERFLLHGTRNRTFLVAREPASAPSKGGRLRVN